MQAQIKVVAAVDLGVEAARPGVHVVAQQWTIFASIATRRGTGRLIVQKKSSPRAARSAKAAVLTVEKEAISAPIAARRNNSATNAAIIIITNVAVGGLTRVNDPRPAADQGPPRHRLAPNATPRHTGSDAQRTPASAAIVASNEKVATIKETQSLINNNRPLIASRIIIGRADRPRSKPRSGKEMSAQSQRRLQAARSTKKLPSVALGPAIVSQAEVRGSR